MPLSTKLVHSFLGKAPVLRSLDPTKLFIVDTNASNVGIGAVLSQAMEQGTVLSAAAMSEDVAGTDNSHYSWLRSAHKLTREIQRDATAKQKRADDERS